jgi:hypothetical protein
MQHPATYSQQPRVLQYSITYAAPYATAWLNCNPPAPARPPHNQINSSTTLWTALTCVHDPYHTALLFSANTPSAHGTLQHSTRATDNLQQHLTLRYSGFRGGTRHWRNRYKQHLQPAVFLSPRTLQDVPWTLDHYYDPAFAWVRHLCIRINRYLEADPGQPTHLTCNQHMHTATHLTHTTKHARTVTYQWAQQLGPYRLNVCGALQCIRQWNASM